MCVVVGMTARYKEQKWEDLGRALAGGIFSPASFHEKVLIRLIAASQKIIPSGPDFPFLVPFVGRKDGQTGVSGPDRPTDFLPITCRFIDAAKVGYVLLCTVCARQ